MSNFTYLHIPVETEGGFTQRAASEVEQAIRDVIHKRGRCTLGLSGGSTPRPIYEELGKLETIEWEKVIVFLVDERYVPSDHPESNQRLVRETLLKGASIPAENVFFPDTGLPLSECVREYAHCIDQLMESGGVDIAILGMGEDGHIASLFPGDLDALLEEERRVIHTETANFPVHDRITVTFPMLKEVQVPIFLLRGEGKKKIFAEVLSANVDPIEYPAHALLQMGRTRWVTWW